MMSGPAGRDAGPRILCSAVGLFVAAVVVAAHDPIKTRVTWTGEISRIVQARCVTCHSPDGRGPMSLTTYEDARPWARAIKEEVMTRRMPKWHAVRGYGDFSNDPSLSPFEIALIAAWADGGAPKGTDSSAGGRDTVATSPESRDAPPSSRDITLPCGEQLAPQGMLLAVRPTLGEDRSVGISVRFPDGRREIVAWIRAFDPEFPMTYKLRIPLLLPPTTILTAEPAASDCSITLTFLAQ